MSDNEVIARAMGLTWHKWTEVNRHGYPGYRCSCGREWDWKDNGCKNPNLTTDTGFWIAWRWAKKQEWWDRFVIWLRDHTASMRHASSVLLDHIDPPVFVPKLAEFLREMK